MLLLRHGNTGKAETDAARQLTGKGIRQCEAFRSDFAPMLANVTNCLASPVSRTMETAQLLLPEVEVLPVDELY